MKNIKGILVIVLVIQLGLVFFLNQGGPEVSFKGFDDPLFSLDWESLDEIEIASQTKSLTLKKENQKWTLPSYFKAPIDEVLIEEALDKLKSLKKGHPVGQTMIAAKQYNVVDDAFEKKVIFKSQGKALLKAYIGSSPGFKKVHVRVGDDKFTFAPKLSVHLFNTNGDHWFKKDIAHLDRDQIAQITFNDISIINEGNFKLQNIPEGKVQKDRELYDLIDRIVSFDVMGIAKMKSDFELRKTISNIQISLKDGTVKSFLFYPEDKEGAHFVAGKFPYVFKVLKGKIARIFDVYQKDLIMDKPEVLSEGDESESE